MRDGESRGTVAVANIVHCNTDFAGNAQKAATQKREFSVTTQLPEKREVFEPVLKKGKEE